MIECQSTGEDNSNNDYENAYVNTIDNYVAPSGNDIMNQFKKRD